MPDVEDTIRAHMRMLVREPGGSSPPPFERAIHRANQRSRRRTALAGTAFILAAATGGLIVLNEDSRPTTLAAQDQDGEPPVRTQREGVELVRIGSTDLAAVRVVADDQNTLTVVAGENAPGAPTQCTTTTIVTIVEQDRERIRLIASVYEVAEPDPSLTCPAGPAYAPTSHNIALDSPFDDRTVVDEKTGAVVPVTK